MPSEILISGLAELETMVANLSTARKKMSNLMITACKIFARKTVQTAQEKYLSRRGPEALGADTGVLKSSIQSTVEPSGSEINITVGTGQTWARAWEYGRPAGKRPPSQPLAEWARRVMGVSEKESKGIGFLIARDIGRKGRKPRPFLAPAVSDNLKSLQDDMDSVLMSWANSGFKYE